MRKRVNTVMALLAISALFTTIAGPVIDHHFAERQASHGHVFAYQAHADHAHMSDDSHDHEGGASMSDGVVATADADVAGFAVDTPAPPSSFQADGAGIGTRVVGTLSDEEFPAGVPVIPLMRPPVA